MLRSSSRASPSRASTHSLTPARSKFRRASAARAASSSLLLSRHAVGEPIEYARAAAAAGLEEICMTCHSPMPEWFDQWPRMTRAELPRYVAMVREAAEVAPVRLKLGIEADYFPGTEGYVAE